jgi:hypothetical protein
LESANGVPAAGASILGIPTAYGAPLIIDVPALVVGNGPNRPSTVTHNSGSAADYVVAQFRLKAVNEPADVSGIVLTGGGIGDWVADVDSATGIQVYADNGDGMFDGADPLLFQSGGAPIVPLTFTPQISVQPATPVDLWVVVNLTSTAGQGAISSPETFTLTHGHEVITPVRDVTEIRSAGGQRAPITRVARGQQTPVPSDGQESAPAERNRLKRFLCAGLPRGPVLSIRGTDHGAVAPCCHPDAITVGQPMEASGGLGIPTSPLLSVDGTDDDATSPHRHEPVPGVTNTVQRLG